MSPSNRQLEERQMRKGIGFLMAHYQYLKLKDDDGATMDEIASNSGLVKATLYYYFNQRKMFSAILEDGWIKIWESIEPVFGGTDSPSIVNLLIKIAEYAKK